MTHQLTIDGEAHWVGTTKQEVTQILETYPAVVDDPGHFYFLCLKTSCPWICQLPSEKQGELRHFFRDVESLRRRRQEYAASIPK